MAIAAAGARANEALGTALAVRHACRAGRLTGTTAGLAAGHVQGNLVILGKAAAADFLRFCQLNPKPCPLVGVSEPGVPHIPALGADLDIRTDLPRYRAWAHGELVAEPTDIGDYWRDDLVAFVIGCSFSFEEALMAEGIRLQHVERGACVPMYRTDIPCEAAGPFRGPLVVSMRPFQPADAIRAVQITSRFPTAHGAPVHFGEPEQIGIRDLMRPDYGDAPSIADGEVPVFWACGVTPQAVIAAVRPDFCITHAPGAMLATDLMNNRLAVI
jgi:uncharacterized protein YcsI (UPF0317 family)